MSWKEVSFEEVRALCMRREVDLVLCSPPPPFPLCLRGEYDGYGEFFSILAHDVEYVELAGGVTVGDVMLSSFATISTISSRWRPLATVWSGPALAIRSADAESWANADPKELYLVVANRLEFRAGPDWEKAGGPDRARPSH